VNDSASRWSVATVAEIRHPSEHASVLRLHVPGWSGNLAGQHVDVRLTAEDGYQATRSYSLADSGRGETIELAVDALPDGEVSPYLVSDVAVGDQLEIRGPIGAYFVWTPAISDPVQLIAGGSGIVPLAAIARAHAAASSPAEMRLLYSVRSRPDAFYADELDALRDASFSLEWVYTRRAPADDPRPVGRVDAAILAATTLPAERDPLVYVCGPTRFVEAVSDLLVAQGHAPERVRTERFGGA
jgi:ferredoxin-NADP reductase